MLNIIIGGFFLILTFWERRFLFIVIATLAAINTSLKAPVKTPFEGKELIYQGTVIGEDHQEYGVKLFISISKALLKNDTLDYPLPVEFYTTSTEIYLGKTLEIKGRIHTSKSAHRPNILTGKIIRISFQENLLGKIFYRIRNYIDALFKLLLNYENYNLSSGLILGGSSRVGKELRDVFTRAGVLHILSVSGFNVGFLISFIGVFLILIPLSNKIKFLIVVFVLFTYAGITGFQPSVSRASLMACLFGAGLIFQRNVDSIHILNIAALVLLIVNPVLLFDVGAQLSFASVYGILYLYPRIDEVLIKKMKTHLLKIIISLMVISFSAQIFVSPLLIQYFHRIQTLACFSNLLIVPLASIITYLLFSCIFVSVFFMPLAKFMAFLASMLLHLLVIISRFFSAIPFSSITLSISPIFLIIFFFFFPRKSRKFTIYAILIMAIIFSIAPFSESAIVETSGDDTLISMSNGENVFITTKQSPKFLFTQGIEKVDYLIAPGKYYPISTRQTLVRQGFFELPVDLRYKKIAIGDMIIELQKDIKITYRNQQINLRDYLPESRNLLYIITNGKNSYRFNTILYGSIFDQLVVDTKILFAQLKLLF